jgi:hypothetical protein
MTDKNLSSMLLYDSLALREAMVLFVHCFKKFLQGVCEMRKRSFDPRVLAANPAATVRDPPFCGVVIPVL